MLEGSLLSLGLAYTLERLNHQCLGIRATPCIQPFDRVWPLRRVDNSLYRIGNLYGCCNAVEQLETAHQAEP